MATLRLVVTPNPADMLAGATSALSCLTAPGTQALPAPSSARSSTPSSWLVVRQGGLRDDVRTLLAGDPAAETIARSVCVFAELPERWGDGARPPLRARERRALLRSILRTHAVGTFADRDLPDAWIGEIDAIIGECVAEGISPQGLEHATAQQHDDPFARDRDALLASVYREYVGALDRNGRSDGRDARVRLADVIRNDDASFARRLGGCRDLRIVGLADLRGGWRSLLSALAASPSVETVTVFTTHALDLDGLRVASPEPELCSTRPPAAVHVIAAADSAREAEQIAVRVHALIDGGATPARIAVVPREARPAVDEICAALARMGVPVSARRRIPLGSTAPARALHLLLSGAAQRWTVRALLDAVESPLLVVPLDAGVLRTLQQDPLASAADDASAASLSSDARVALQRLLARCSQRDRRPGGVTRGDRLPETSRVLETAQRLSQFLSDVEFLGARHDLQTWYGWVVDAIGQSDAPSLLAAPATTDGAVHDIDVRAREEIVARAQESLDAPLFINGDDGPHSAAEFLSRLTELFTDPLIMPARADGVVVAEALAVAWRSFDHVFMTGLVDGQFPIAPSTSALLDRRDRERLIARGLPLDGPDAWRSREAELFRVLTAAPTLSLTLSWPEIDASGYETNRSEYADGLLAALAQPGGAIDATQITAAGEPLTRGFPIVPAFGTDASLQHAELQQAARVANIERDRTRTISRYNGAIVDETLLASLDSRFGPDYRWSATSIEELAKCGWQWMASRLLGLDQRTETTDAIDPSVTGTILHRALDSFFERARARTGAPVFLRAHDLPWALPLLQQALQDAWRSEEAESWLGAPALRGLMRSELMGQLDAYLRFETERNEKSFNNRSPQSKSIRAGAAHGEFQFDDVPITVDGVTFLLRGVIDRIDIGVDERVPNAASYVVAIDFKSSKGSTPAFGKRRGWDDGVVLQVPLYAAVLRQLYPDGILARLEYRTLRNPEVVHPLQFVKLDKASKSGAQAVIEVPDAATQLDAAMRAAASRVTSARRGTFPAAPAPSCGCSPYCPAREVCRIPSGPVDGNR